MSQKKICMLGSFAVGKTSLVSRYVHSLFSEEYHTTVGVKIDKKSVETSSGTIDLVIWDLAGEDELIPLRTSFLRGAAAYFLVVDGTRASTLETARDLRDRVEKAHGPIPYVLLVNKADLSDHWNLDRTLLDDLAGRARASFETSARSGASVDEAFLALAGVVADE